MIFLLGPLHWSYINFQHSENAEVYCSYVQIWVSPNHFTCCRSVIFSLTIQRAHSGKLFSGWGAHYLQTLRLLHKQIVKLIKTFYKHELSNKVVKYFRNRSQPLKIQISPGERCCSCHRFTPLPGLGPSWGGEIHIVCSLLEFLLHLSSE